MRDLLQLVLGFFNPADNGEDESRVNQVVKVLGTIVIVLGAIASFINELLEVLAGTPTP